MCTGIRLIADDKVVVYARTMEFGKDMKSNILTIPRNYSLIATAPSGKAEGLSWKSKYAAVGANAFDQICLLDGVNEKGLAGGLFYFPDYAEFQKVSASEIAQSLAAWELLTWILTNFSDVEQVQKALPQIKVSNAIFQPWGIVPPVHAIIHDVQGNSLVIEYIRGNLMMHSNPLGVFTNAPYFDWHMTNISNYMHLSPYNKTEQRLGDFTIQSLGQGSGMLGLPGDFTSPSRFIRALAFSQSVIEKKDASQLKETAFRVLNFFNIPLGIVREETKSETYYEYTQWTTVSDLHNRRYYWNTYDNTQIKSLDLLSCLNEQKINVMSM